ncbi:hypothetical protein PybrP1_003621 [[Pythium] brassicae (nom. inval.)]|nr:hypothetical protein PybrP1_003621 [[Pythium] brassicae (nom. inval.)]
MADAYRAKAPGAASSSSSSKSVRHPPRKPSVNGRAATNAHPKASVRPTPPAPVAYGPPVPAGGSTVLPRIERRGSGEAATRTSSSSSNNNNNSDDISTNSSLAMAISSHAVPTLTFGFSPRLPSSNSDSASESSPTTRSTEFLGARDGPPAKAAWCTPRSPLESHLASLFAAARAGTEQEDERERRSSSAAPTATPARLKSVEDRLRETDALYRVDLDTLVANSDKFLEVSHTAAQHVEGIESDLPQLATTFEHTTTALSSLSRDLAALHERHERDKDAMLEQLDEVFNQGTDEKIALVEAHDAERRELQRAREREVGALDAQFRDHVQALDAKYDAMETARLDELQQLRAVAAAQLEDAQAIAARDHAALAAASQQERDALERALRAELQSLKTSSDDELAALARKSSAAYDALESTSRAEYDALKRSSSEEIRALREASASQFAEATDALTRQLEAVRQSNADELEALRAARAGEISRLTDQCERETAALQRELNARTTTLSAEIDALVEHHAQECEATASAADWTLQSLKSAHAEQLERLRAHAAAELAETVGHLQGTIARAADAHAGEAARLRDDANVTHAALAERYETELATLRTDSKRERDHVTLLYETEIDALRRSSLEALDRATKAHESSAAQLCDTHSAKTLQLEAAAREQEKRFAETMQAQNAELARRQDAIDSLESTLGALERQHRNFVDTSAERVARCEMDSCEREARMLAVQRELCEQLAALEQARAELRAAGDDKRVKANTILELTFVVKSRDDEVERLRAALLDSVKSVNQQTEILELTTETLSSKAKELEATRAALRKESGRLSRVEESMHQKDGMLEDTELKVENMRLSMESLRLELKRLQMDMKLQLEHTEGEMELKNGEIGRLHAAQSELRHKSAFQQQTIARLEESLAQSEKLVDDAQRRICLLRLEAAQSADAAKTTSDALLARDAELLALAKDKQSALFEKQRAQLQLTHLAQVIAGLHETSERGLMLGEEIQTRFLTVLAETAAEKDERLRAEKHLLVLELSAAKERVRHLEGVEARLAESRKESEAQRAQLQSLSGSIRELEAAVAAFKEVEQSLELARREVNELTATRAEKEHALACTHDQLRFENEAARSSVAALTTTLEELREQVEALRAERDALESQFQSLSNDHAALTNEHISLTNDHAALTNEHTALTNEHVVLTNAHNALTSDCEQLRARASALAQQNEQLTTALSGEKLEMTGSIERMVSDLEAAKQQFETQLRDAAAKLQSAESAAEGLQRELAFKCQEAAELQSAALGLEHELCELKLETSTQRAKRQELEHEVRRLEEALQDAAAEHARGVEESERELLLKSEETARLERDYELKLSAQAEAHAQALREAEDASDATRERLETALREQHEAFASQLEQQSVAQRAGADDEQKRLVDDHVRQLSEADDARRSLAAHHEAAASALTAAHAEELARVQQERAAANELLAAANAATREREGAHEGELKSVRDAYERELASQRQQLEDASAKLAQDFEQRVEAIVESTQHEAELGRLRAAEEHLRKLEGVVESARVKDEQQLKALSSAQAAAASKEALLEDATARLARCEEQAAQLLRELTQSKQALVESHQLVAERTVTIDNVRRELSALHDTTNATVATQSGDQLLAHIRQQLDTHLWDAYQLDRAQVAGSGCALETESDVVECLKSLFRLRCAALAARRSATQSAGGSAELVLSVSDACTRLDQWDTIAAAHDELFASSRECAPDALASHVHALLAGYRCLLDHVRRSFRVPVASGGADAASDPGRSTSWELESAMSHLSAFSKMLSALGLLGAENPQMRCERVLGILNDHDQLLQHAAGSSDWLGITTLADVAALLDTVRDVLADARRVTGQCERFRTPTDLQSLVLEHETLFTSFAALANGSESQDDDDSTEHTHEETPHLSPKTAEVLRFVRQSQRFLAGCNHALGLADSSSFASEVLVCIRELMKVLQCFTGLESACHHSAQRASSSSSLSPTTSPAAVTEFVGASHAGNSPRCIQVQVASVLSFLDELHLMTGYAQSILDEESDATASTGASSNASSIASLRGSQPALTRTPTPSAEVESGDSDGNDSGLQIEVPLPLDELELELQQHDACDDRDDAQIAFLIDDSDSQDARGARAAVAGARSPSTPLATSLVDISLVMSDHQRVLSEAAHWVKKTARLRRRRSSRARAPTDLGSEICRLVREHCALLALGKKLFQLKDPRRDLPSLLESLAVLRRLTTRLSVFQDGLGSVNGNSASSESLDSLQSLATSSARSNAGSHESLRASLSVFACLEDVARHLQDYDVFLQHMRDSCDKQWLAAGGSDIEWLAHDVSSRLELVEHAQSALGLQNPVLELPTLLERVRELLSKTAGLDPWHSTAETTGGDEAAEVDEHHDSDSDSGAPTASVAAAVVADLQGLEAHAAAFGRIERDLADYSALVSWLRRALPFAQCVQSPDDLRERVQEVLAQLELFANTSVEASDELAVLRAERERALQQQALEDAYLAGHGVAGSADASRLEVFQQLVDERQQLRTATINADASACLETDFLRQSGLLQDGSEHTTDDSGDGGASRAKLSTTVRVQIYTTLLHKLQTGEDTRRRLEAELVDQAQRLEGSELALRDAQRSADDATQGEQVILHTHEQLVAEIARLSARERAWEQEDCEERAALCALGLLASTDASAAEDTNAAAAAPLALADRLSLYRKLAELERLAHVTSDTLSAEKRFLADNGLAFDDADPAAARLTVYKALLSGQNALIDEKMEREVELDSERAFLETHGVAGGSTSAVRMEVYRSLLQLRAQLAERDEADAMERAFLRSNGLWQGDGPDGNGDSDNARMDAQEQFGARIQVFSEYAEARAAESLAERERAAAVAAERAFLREHTSLDAALLDSVRGPQFSRLRVFEELVAAQRDADAQRAARSLAEADELELLRSIGCAALLESTGDGDAGSVFAARRKVYTELSDRVRERDELISKLEGSREKFEAALMVWNEVPLVGAAAFARLEAETHALRVVVEQRDAQLEQLRQQAAAAVTAQGDMLAVELTAAAAKHTLALEQLERTHSEQLAGVEATGTKELATALEKHTLDLEQLERTHSEQLAGVEAASKKELAAALEKQAKQLEFLALAEARLSGAAASLSSPASALAPAQARALLLDKVAKRDTAAISMIYRSIRVATDILNTFAFARSGGAGTESSQSAAELPVEVTQAVLNCVKELKALKEYVAASLEQLTRGDDAFPPQPPPFLQRNVDAAVASGDRDAAIDLALCSHREFMAFAHCELLARQEATGARLQELLDRLKAVATAAFPVADSALLALEIERVREREAHDSAACELQLNDAYLRRLLAERKDVEAALSTALAELRDECRALRAKVDALEHERYSSASGLHMFGLTPRPTPVTPSYALAPMRPEKPRESAPPLRAKGGGVGGAGSMHKERFVSDLERETGQRRSTSTARRPNEWRRQDVSDPSASSSSQLEKEFRAMDQFTYGAAGTTVSSALARGRDGGLEPPPGHAQDQELWYQGVRSVRHIAFFVTVFFVPKQSMFRVELFNSDTEQQQTVYVTRSEMLAFVAESARAAKVGLAGLEEPGRRVEVVDVLFERVRVYGEGSASVLLGFE